MRLHRVRTVLYPVKCCGGGNYSVFWVPGILFINLGHLLFKVTLLELSLSPAFPGWLGWWRSQEGHWFRWDLASRQGLQVTPSQLPAPHLVERLAMVLCWEHWEGVFWGAGGMGLAIADMGTPCASLGLKGQQLSGHLSLLEAVW